MKRFSLFFAIIMVLLSGCGGSDEEKRTDTDTTKISASTIKNQELIFSDKIKQTINSNYEQSKDKQDFSGYAMSYYYGFLLNGSFDPKLAESMRKLDPDRSVQVEKGLEIIEKVQNEPVWYVPNEYEENHLFILLGYALNSDGTMNEILRNRLDLAVEALQKNTTASIIVTGGVKKKGKTESDVMRQYLVDSGIDSKRVFPENKATNTILNMKNSLSIINTEGLSPKITLISSGDHVKRAKTDLEAVISLQNLNRKYEIDMLGTKYTYSKKENDDEVYACFRDVLMIYGVK